MTNRLMIRHPWRMKRVLDAVYPSAVAKLQNNLTALVNARGQVLALRSSTGAVTCTNRRDFARIEAGSTQVTAWLELCPTGASLAERQRLASRVLRLWKIRVPTEMCDQLQKDHVRIRALQAARLARLAAKGQALLKAPEVRMKRAA